MTFAAVYNICFSFIVLHINQAVRFLDWFVSHLFRGLLWLAILYIFCSLLKAVLLPIAVNIYVIWFRVVSCLICNCNTSYFNIEVKNNETFKIFKAVVGLWVEKSLLREQVVLYLFIFIWNFEDSLVNLNIKI